jgi:hypothetical protein
MGDPVPKDTPGFEPYRKRLTFTEAIKLLAAWIMGKKKEPYPPHVDVDKAVRDAFEKAKRGR